MIVLDLTTLKTVPGGLPRAAAARAVANSGANGQLIGVWTSEIGTLNALLQIRLFDDVESCKRQHASDAADARLRSEDQITSITQETFLVPDGFPLDIAGQFGPFYEIRRYELRSGGLSPTLEAWRAALPKRLKMSRLAVFAHALDYKNTILHIWPYQSLDERQSVRGKAAREGIWPPKNSLQWIASAQSEIFMPLDSSPLR